MHISPVFQRLQREYSTTATSAFESIACSAATQLWRCSACNFRNNNLDDNYFQNVEQTWVKI